MAEDWPMFNDEHRASTARLAEREEKSRVNIKHGSHVLWNGAAFRGPPSFHPWGLVFYQLGEVCDVEVFSLSPFLSLKFADFGRRLADVQ